MKRRCTLAVVIAATLVASVAAQPAQATFPGSNGLIAFVQPDHGGQEIFSMNPDGTGIRQLTHLAPHHIAASPAWSPDGSQIVFERMDAKYSNNHIWMMAADGSNLHRLFPDPWFTDSYPSFSPDGTKVLFSHCQHDPGLEQGRCAVATVNVDGAGITRLTQPQLEELAWWPTYSPDGTRIAFTVFYGRGVRAGIFVMNADGSNVDLVTPPGLEAFMSDWAPDGSRLVFTTHCCRSKTTQAIWAVNAGGTGLVQITSPGERHDFQPVTSPDGTRIVFERDRADYSGWGLYTMNPDGTGIARIANRKAYSAAWQPVA